MPPDFLPLQVKQLIDQLIEPSSLTFAQGIQCQDVFTSLSQQAIATSYVHQGSSELRQSHTSPILLLHGFDSSVMEFRSLVPLLAAQQETWAVDLLGFGFTDRIPGVLFNPFAIKTHLHSFWKTLIKRPVTLIGASMGGATAIDFALSFPEVVQRLILINSLGFTGGFPLGQFLFAPIDFLAVEYWRQRKLQALNFYSAFRWWDISVLDALQCAGLHLEMPRWNEAMIAFTKSGGYVDLGSRITHIQQPTLILWGEADETLGTGDAERFRRAIASSKLIWLKNCGHVPQLEQPQLTAQHILEF